MLRTGIDNAVPLRRTYQTVRLALGRPFADAFRAALPPPAALYTGVTPVTSSTSSVLQKYKPFFRVCQEVAGIFLKNFIPEISRQFLKRCLPAVYCPETDRGYLLLTKKTKYGILNMVF